MVVKQICYYNESDIKQILNHPQNVTGEDLINGFILTDAIYNEIQIKAFPGTMLEINGQEVVIGNVGVYNILYEENMEILTIKVSSDSIKNIKQFDDAFIIITAMRDN